MSAMPFQSTLSVRRATPQTADNAQHEEISIHALREESDDPPTYLGRGILLFQSTLSVRRATGERESRVKELLISIHALREESDCTDGQHVSHCGTSILRTSSRVAGFEVKTRYSNHSTKK